MSIDSILEDQNPWWREPAVRMARQYPLRRRVQKLVFEQLGRFEDRRAVVVLGPRQVGKTTLLLQTVDDLLDRGIAPANIVYFDFADDRILGEPSVRDVAEARPPGSSADQPRFLLLDEVSRAPRWDLWLKGAVDRREARITATDSASSVLRHGGSESGQGRWDELWLETLSFREFLQLHAMADESVDGVLTRGPDLLERYLAVGGFPEHALELDLLEVRRRLRADVVDRAILRDLAGRVDDPIRVRDLFVYVMQESGGELNVKDRATDLDADPRSVRAWMALLADTLLTTELTSLTPHAAARLRSKPKIYAADHGLVIAFAATPDPLYDPRVRGRIFEAVVFRHLRELARQLPLAQIGYLRHKDREVDFILRAERTVAIEVTSSSKVAADKLRRAATAATVARADRLVVLHGGLEERTTGAGTRLVPLVRFLLDPSIVLGVDS